MKLFGLTKELQKPWNMKLTVMRIVVGTLETISKKVEIKGRIETIQTKALLKSAEINFRVQET